MLTQWPTLLCAGSNLWKHLMHHHSYVPFESQRTGEGHRPIPILSQHSTAKRQESICTAGTLDLGSTQEVKV